MIIFLGPAFASPRQVWFQNERHHLCSSLVLFFPFFRARSSVIEASTQRHSHSLPSPPAALLHSTDSLFFPFTFLTARALSLMHSPPASSPSPLHQLFSFPSSHSKGTLLSLTHSLTSREQRLTKPDAAWHRRGGDHRGPGARRHAGLLVEPGAGAVVHVGHGDRRVALGVAVAISIPHVNLLHT